MHGQRSSVTDTSLGSFQTCLDLMADTWLPWLPFASSWALHLRLASCSVLLILLLTVRVLAKVPLTHHQKTP